jgi:hypothetical protein
LIRHTDSRPIRRSLETGTGKTTLLLSHLSERHRVHTRDDGGAGDSLAQVRASPLLRSETVEFVVGPTQVTLRAEPIQEPLDLAFLDGPHGYPFPELEYYAIYPQLAQGALLVVDDVHIPTIANLFAFLREDRMFELLEVCGNCAFFTRTDAPTFDPLGDNWWTQAYNERHHPSPLHLPLAARVRASVALRTRLRSAVRALRARARR